MTKTVTAAACYLCGSTSTRQEAARVRDRADVQVLACNGCGLVFLSSASHIGPDFYESSSMHAAPVDLASWRTDTAPDDERRFRFCEPLMAGKRVLDFGCGNGSFLLKAQSVASSVAGLDLEALAQSNLQQHGVAFETSLDAFDRPFDVVTMFHVLEHLHDPRATLRAIASHLAPGGRIIVEVPSADDALIKLYQSAPFKAFTYWSCHLFLFTASTLRALFGQAGATTENLRYVQRYPLSNHLYWLAHGKPGGHREWIALDSPALAEAYEAQLASLELTDTLVATITFEQEPA